MPTGPHSCERVVGVYVIIFCLLSGFVTGWGSFRLKVHFFQASRVSVRVFFCTHVQKGCLVFPEVKGR